MIDLDIKIENPEELIQENILTTALQKAADVDTASIRKTIADYKDPNKNVDILDVGKSMDTHGLKRAGDIADKIDTVLNKQQVSTQSLVARAKNSVLQFPVYVTQSLRVNEAHVISKTFERVYATLVQTVLSQSVILDEEDANNLVFLKQFHTNLRESVDGIINEYYEPIDEFDRIMTESIFYSAELTESLSVEFRLIPPINEDLISENTRLMHEPLTGFHYLREADQSPMKPSDTSRIATEDDTTLFSDQELVDAAKDSLKSKIQNDLQDQFKKLERDLRDDWAANQDLFQGENDFQKNLKGIKDEDLSEEYAKITQDQVNAELNRLKELIKNGKNVKINGKVVNYKLSHGKDVFYTGGPSTHPVGLSASAPNAPKLLNDGDIKKINGMLPYTIEASFRLRSKKGDLDRDVKYILGIKTALHLISPTDLSKDLREIVTGDIKTLRRVRYKTGEMNFKDYWFNLKGLKADAAKHINYDKRWLNTLKRLGEYNKLHGTILKNVGVKAITGGEVPIPNGTLVLSQMDISKLTNETGIDLSSVANAKKLAESLFLIAVVIVDITASNMKVLFPDSDTNWDIQSLDSLAAELAKTDNSALFKEIQHKINR